jgi:hypothetical protein
VVHYLLQADMVRAQYLTLLGGRRWKEFAVSSTSEPTGYHPLASFKVGVPVQPAMRSKCSCLKLLLTKYLMSTEVQRPPYMIRSFT